MTSALNRLTDAFTSFRTEYDSDKQMSEPVQTSPNIANPSDTLAASTEQLERHVEQSKQRFHQFQQLHLHHANSKRELSSSPVFQQIHPNMIPVRIQPALYSHPT